MSNQQNINVLRYFIFFNSFSDVWYLYVCQKWCCNGELQKKWSRSKESSSPELCIINRLSTILFNRNQIYCYKLWFWILKMKSKRCKECFQNIKKYRPMYLNIWCPSWVKTASLTKEVCPLNSFKVFPDFNPWILQKKISKL